MSGRTGTAAAPLPITLNGRPVEIAAGSSLADLLELAAIAAPAVATAVNGDFVARARRAEHRLGAGDRVSCFQAIVGG